MLGHVDTERQGCSGRAPKLDRAQRRVFVGGQAEAVLALRKRKDRGTETGRAGRRKKEGQNDNRTGRKAHESGISLEQSVGG